MAIDRLLRPRSIAIVGASEKIGPGFNAWNALKTVGYAGAIHLIATPPGSDSLRFSLATPRKLGTNSDRNE